MLGGKAALSCVRSRYANVQPILGTGFERPVNYHKNPIDPPCEVYYVG